LSEEDDEIEWIYMEGYDDDPDEEVCPEGYTEDEWCDPEHRLGIETCEFCCPFGRIDQIYEEMEKRRKVIKRLKEASKSDM